MASSEFYAQNAMPMTKNDMIRIKNIFNRASETPEGDRMIQTMLKHKVRPMISDADSGMRSVLNYFSLGVHSLSAEASIFFNAVKTDPDLVEGLLHEARHFEQVVSDVILPKVRLSPADMVWFKHVIEADAQATAVVAVMKEKHAGKPDMFCLGQRGAYAHMYAIAEKHYAADTSCLDTPSFKRRVFDAWFDAPPVVKYSGRMIKNRYDELLLNGGLSYCDAEYKKAGVAISPLTRAMLEPIGVCGGESVNYLTLPRFRPLDDPYYKKVNNFSLRRKIKACDTAWKKNMKAPAP